MYVPCSRNTNIPIESSEFIFSKLATQDTVLGLKDPPFRGLGSACHSRVCTPMPGVVCGSMVSMVRSLAWGLVCIAALSLANCSSSWCWMCLRTSSASACHGSFSLMLMIWCTWQKHWRIVSTSSWHGRLAWNVNGSVHGCLESLTELSALCLWC